jgi:small-conductance mechanosensitive channel
MLPLPDSLNDLLLALSVPGLYCLLVLIGRQLKRRCGVRLGLFYHLFSISFAIYVPSILLNPQWPFVVHLGAATVIFGSTVLIALIDRYIWDLHFQQRHGVKVPKFFTELVRIIILVLAVFVVLEFAYGQTVKGLLVAPGIAAVVIGLAMQDLLGNIIAGVALQAGKSFAYGDWLWIENRYAEVIEIKWRSTRLRTLDDIFH